MPFSLSAPYQYTTVIVLLSSVSIAMEGCTSKRSTFLGEGLVQASPSS
jgi:hypothetical protein